MIILRDRRRAAALHMLDHTPLGDTFARLADHDLATFASEPDSLTLGLHKHAERTMSSGEYALWAFLVALTHGNAINLHRLLNSIDADCQRAVVEAIAIWTGVDELDVSGVAS